MDFSAQIQQLLKDKAYHTEQVKLIEDAVVQLSSLNRNPLFRSLGVKAKEPKPRNFNISKEVDAVLADFAGEFTSRDMASAVAGRQGLDEDGARDIQNAVYQRLQAHVRAGNVTVVRPGNLRGQGSGSPSVYRRTDAIPQPQARRIPGNGVSIAMEELRGHFVQQA